VEGRQVNWDAIGAIGELIGAFAVLSTLVYLAVQVKHGRTLLDDSRRIALSQVHQLRAESMKNIHKMAMEEPLRGVIEKTGSSDSTATTAMKIGAIDHLEQWEKVLLGRWYSQLLIHLDDVVYQASLGLLDQDDLVDREKRKELAQQHFAMAEKLHLHVPPRLRRDWLEKYSI